MTRPPRGAALLEVVVALALLAVAGVALLELAVQSNDAVLRSRDAGAELRLANGFLESVSLWPRSDLDRHLGVRDERAFLMQVERPSPTLYRVVLYDRQRGIAAPRELLATTLFRQPEAR